MVEVAKKTFHGKVVKKITKEKINKKPASNKFVKLYLKSIKRQVIKEFLAVKTKSKTKGKSFAKIQIQKTGDYDVLFIQGDNNKVQTLTEDLFSKISKFKPIPTEAGQSELQIKIPLIFN